MIEPDPNVVDSLERTPPWCSYPLLYALCWQGTTADLTSLSEAELLQVYERGWRWRAKLIEPTAEEVAFIWELAERYSSWLINHV